MNSKAPVVILILLCLGLLVGLVVRHNQAASAQRAAEARIQELAKDLEDTKSQREQLESQTSKLRQDVDVTRATLEQTAQQLSQTKEVLARTETAVQAATQSLKEKETELAKREGRIAELEGQNSSLDRQANEMRGAITSLEGQITLTRQKLDAAEGDRDFLLEELHRLQTEKAEMERRLSDVVALREQIVHLRDQLSVARQIENLRRNLYGAEPGRPGETPLRGVRPADAAPGPDLNVEIRRDGTATILTVPTNAPPAPE